jgi:hypothetical protein
MLHYEENYASHKYDKLDYLLNIERINSVLNSEKVEAWFC